MEHRLLLTEPQAAALAAVDVVDLRKAYRAGRLPRWCLPGSRTPHYNIRDVSEVFSVPPDALKTVLAQPV